MRFFAPSWVMAVAVRRVTLGCMRHYKRASYLMPAQVPAQGTRMGVLGDQSAR